MNDTNPLSSVKISNMESSRGNTIANQFIIRVKSHDPHQVGFDSVYFQSYDSIIAVKTTQNYKESVTLDSNKWDYSTTTGKYRNIFLGENKKATQAKIDNGTYQLSDLN